MRGAGSSGQPRRRTASGPKLWPNRKRQRRQRAKPRRWPKIAIFRETETANVKKKPPETLMMEQVRRRVAEQRILILEIVQKIEGSIGAVKAAAQRTVTEKERLWKEMLERMRRFNAMIARRDYPQRHERHTHKQLGPSVTSQDLSDLTSHNNDDVMPKHEKEMEKRGSRIKVVMPTAVQQTGYPRTTFCKDQGQPEVLVER